MSWLEHKIPPPIVVLIAAAGMWPLAGITPAIPLDNFWRWIVAGGLALGGLLIARSGVRDFVRAETTINPVNIDAASTLVTTGIFAYTRNPMYLGMTILLLGWAIFLSGVWTFLGPFLFVPFIARFQILPEERVLAGKFGASYKAYTQEVRRWI
jgi:protein-S-isoprenylcysteine O-methyltransferase Ste14